jgi:hypothetical protein
MSVTNIINNEELTLVQGVGGLFLCEESWITQNRRNTYRKEISDKDMITTKDESNGIECSQTELWDLP